MSSRWGLLLCGLLVVGSSLFAAVRHLGWSRDLERRERDLAVSIAGWGFCAAIDRRDRASGR